MIVGLVSCYDEGRLALDAVRSLLACPDVPKILVHDSPIGREQPRTNPTDWQALSKEPRVTISQSNAAFPDDATKRTHLLERTRRYPPPTWGVILDGDELLLHADQLPALIEWHEANAGQAGQESLRIPLRILEGDGSSGVMTGRVVRLDLVQSWILSSYHIRLQNGVEVSLANGYFLKPGEPDRADMDATTGLQIRRPLPGEPCVLHRSWLRHPGRQAARQSVAEGDAFERLARDAGLSAAASRVPDGPRIWLPE